MNDYEGLIIKGIGGFYYVKTAGELYICKAKGIFRKDKIKPLPGDKVHISVDDNDDGIINSIMPRKNLLTRPAIANIDKIFITISVDEPKPVLLLVDKMTVLANYIKAEPIILINKIDLSPNEAKNIQSIYMNSGIDSFCVCAKTGEGMREIKNRMQNCVSVLTGNTGVGKSSIINSLIPNLSVETNEISKALKRGVHTTRQTTLYSVENGYIADTPGFSTLTLDSNSDISCDELYKYFYDFLPYMDNCKFTDCNHLQKNRNCGVFSAVKNGKIKQTRYNNYCSMYEEIKNKNTY